MTGSVEGAAVLNCDADIPGAAKYIIQCFAGLSAVLCAVDKEHIGALGAADLDRREVGLDVVAGKCNVLAEDRTQLIDPLIAFGLVGAD